MLITRTARNIISEIQLLCLELDELLIVEGDARIGAHVRISKGTHHGKRGVVTRRRGATFFYVLLDCGLEIYKRQDNLTVLSRPSL